MSPPWMYRPSCKSKRYSSARNGSAQTVGQESMEYGGIVLLWDMFQTLHAEGQLTETLQKDA